MQNANHARRGVLMPSSTPTATHKETHVQCDVCQKTFRGFSSFGKHLCDSRPIAFDKYDMQAELEEQQINLRERVSSMLLL